MPQLIEHADFYFDASGYMVLTEKYLKERGKMLRKLMYELSVRIPKCA